MLQITVVSDFICPWCYIGLIRLKNAIVNTQTQDRITLGYAPFLLYPNTPINGQSITEFPKKHGLGSKLRMAGKELGIEFNFNRISKIPNTQLAHNILLNVESNFDLLKTKETIFEQYFTYGKDISDPNVLEDITKNLGVSYAISKDFNLNESLLFARNLGISAVPSFVINKEHVITGAQETERLEKFLSRIK